MASSAFDSFSADPMIKLMIVHEGNVSDLFSWAAVGLATTTMATKTGTITSTLTAQAWIHL